MTRKKRSYALFSFEDTDDDPELNFIREEQTTFDSNRARKRISLSSSTSSSSSSYNFSSCSSPSSSQASSSISAENYGKQNEGVSTVSRMQPNPVDVDDTYVFSSTVDEVRAQDHDPETDLEDFDSGMESMDSSDEDEESLKEIESLDSKRLRFKSLDDFRDLKPEFLRQLMRVYCPSADIEICTSCRKTGASILCLDCFHFLNRCQTCILEEHTHQPLHRIQYFDGCTWHRTTLGALGLKISLCYRGMTCPSLSPATTKKIVVIDLSGIQEVNVSFCNCDRLIGLDSLERYQLMRHGWYPATTEHPGTVATFSTLDAFEAMSGEGKLSGYHFYRCLLRLSNGLGLKTIPKRYEEFMRMSREYQHLKMIQRSGKICRVENALAINDGELAVECPACPHPGKNLPEDWEKRLDVWIYTLFIMIDANFRLKSKKKRSQNDADLGGGLSYFVRDDRYKEYLKRAVQEKEIKYCDSGLRAIDHANLRGGKGYNASGVVGVQCRHMLIRSNGFGDLQKGEKYANIDYVLLSSLRNLNLSRVILSYDINCQYSRNFQKRMQKLDKELQLDLSKVSLSFVIPQFHIYGHGDNCRTRYNLRFREFVGRTDGENIERGWASLNPLSMASKEMGPGARSDFLDWHIGDWNNQRILTFGRLFLSKLKEAVRESVKHASILVEFRKSLTKGFVSEVEVNIRKWNLDPNNNIDPYAEHVHGVSILKARRELAQTEAREDAGGVLFSGDVSATHWLTVGFELESSQRSAKASYKVSKKNKLTRISTSAMEKNTSILRKIRTWKNTQLLHMPKLIEYELWEPMPDGTSPPCWTISLNMPSSISAELRDVMCPNGLANKEYLLRFAQAQDTLDEIRQSLQRQWWLSRKKRQHVTGPGQRNNTQSSCAIQALRERRDVAVDRYRRTREALAALKPEGDWQTTFKVLKDEDLRPMEDDEGKGEGRRTLSWIWVVKGAASSDEGDIYNGLKVEYAKARARAQRWLEEAQLVREEMRRVLCYFDWKSNWWLEQVSGLKGSEGEDVRGCIVYGNRQALTLQQLGMRFRTMWVDCNIDDFPGIQDLKLITIKEINDLPEFEKLTI